MFNTKEMLREGALGTIAGSVLGGGQIATANVIKGFNKGDFEIPAALEQKTAGAPKKVLNESYYDMGEMAKRVFGIDIDKASNPQSTMFAAAVETELKEKQVKNISEAKAAIEKLHSGEVLTKYEENIIEDVGGYKIANRIADSKEYRAAKRIGKQIEIKRRQLEKAGVDKESAKIRAVTETLFCAERDNGASEYDKKAFFSPENKQYMKHVEQMGNRYGTKDFAKVLDKMTDREYEQYSNLLNDNPVFNKKNLKNITKNGIIQPRNIGSREMANAHRRSRSYVLNDEDKKFVLNEADAIKIPKECLRFNEGTQTGFSDLERIINIKGDIFPDDDSEYNRDRLSVKAVLAHEYYGHYNAYPSPYKVGDWHDEFNASYRAAIDTPNLTVEDRTRLMIDAYERANDAGEPLQYDEVAKRIIYGIELK